MRIIKATQTFHVGDRYRINDSGPSDPNRPCFRYTDHEHTPSNKRNGEVQSMALVYVEDFKGSDTAEPWLNINLEEITTVNGRTAGREISVVLKGEALATLKAMLAEPRTK